MAIEGITTNGRKFVVTSIENADDEFDAMPAAPFAALVVAPAAKPDKTFIQTVARRIVEGGCCWIGVKAGRFTEKVHQLIDPVVVDYENEARPDFDIGAGGESEDSLEEAVRNLVFYGASPYNDMSDSILVVVLPGTAPGSSDNAAALLKGVTEYGLEDSTSSSDS